MTEVTDMTMRAILCDSPRDDLSTTRLTDVPVPVPGPGEVRVRMMAAGINPVDWKLCAGVAPWWDAPHVVGLDGAGVIDALGDGVEGWAPGDRIVWHGNLNAQGVFADYAVAPAHVVSRIPDTVGYAEAAALPCAGYTAFQGLVRKARIRAGEVVAVQGGTGGAGGFAIQIAKAMGARVIALAREAAADHVLALGADDVVDYRAPDLPARLRAANGGEGVDIVFEVVNPGDARASLDLLRYNGQLVTIDPLPDLSRTPSYTYAASIHEVALGGAYGAGHLPTQRDFAAIGDRMLGWLAEGRLDPMISERIGLDGAVDALARLRAGRIRGKAIIEITSDAGEETAK